MSGGAFHAVTTAKLTSTITSQTVTVPAGFSSLLIYNAAANPVHLRYGATVAAPSTFAAGDGIMTIQPSTTQTFAVPMMGGTLAYIAETAGGALYLTVGEGV